MGIFILFSITNIEHFNVFSPSNYFREEGQYEPEEIMDMLNRLGNLIQMERKMEKYVDDIVINHDLI